MPTTSDTDASVDPPRPNLTITFVCTGNICRSPMAEVVLRDALADAGLGEAITVRSCGMRGYHVGDGADPRALAELARHGHDGSAHRASQFGPTDAAADLIVALDTGHAAELKASGAQPEKIRLLRSFDDDATELSVADPYYGGPEGFRRTYGEIARAIPGIVAWASRQLKF